MQTLNNLELGWYKYVYRIDSGYINILKIENDIITYEYIHDNISKEIKLSQSNMKNYNKSIQDGLKMYKLSQEEMMELL